MKQKLKPCPFCGFDLEKDGDHEDIVYPATHDKRVWSVNCPEESGGCSAQILGSSAEDAIKNWNRRKGSKAN